MFSTEQRRKTPQISQTIDIQSSQTDALPSSSIRLAKISMLHKKLESLNSTTLREKSAMRKELEVKLKQAQSAFEKYTKSNKQALTIMKERVQELKNGAELDKGLYSIVDKRTTKELQAFESNILCDILKNKKKLSTDGSEGVQMLDKEVETLKTEFSAGQSQMKADSDTMIEEVNKDFGVVIRMVEERKEERKRCLMALEREHRSSDDKTRMQAMLDNERKERESNFKEIITQQDFVWNSIQQRLATEQKLRDDAEERLLKELETACGSQD